MFRRQKPQDGEQGTNTAPDKALKRRERLYMWLQQLPRWQQTIIAFVLVLAIIGLLEVLFSLALIFTSLRTDDLAIFLSTSTNQLTLTNGQSGIITAELGVKNLLLCSALCAWNATDLENGATLGRGVQTLSSGDQVTLPIAVSSTPRGEQNRLVKVSVSCENEQSRFCKSVGETVLTSSAVRVETRFSTSQQAEREKLQTSLQTWHDRARELDSKLDAIQNDYKVNSTRAAMYVPSAQVDRRELAQRVIAVQAAFDRDDFTAASELLTLSLPQTTHLAYSSDEVDEKEFVFFAQNFTNREQVVRELEALMPDSDVLVLNEAISKYNSSITEFDGAALTDTRRKLGIANLIVDDLENRSTSKIKKVQSFAQSVYQEKLVLCAVANVSCNATLPNITLSAAARSASTDCAFVSSSNLTYSNARAYILQRAKEENTSIALNSSEYEVLSAYGVHNLTMDSEFYSSVAQTRAAIINASQQLLTMAQRLAFPLNLTDVTVDAASAICPLRQASITIARAPTPVLNSSRTGTSVLPAPLLPGRKCCAANECEVCPAAPQTAVLFVHGFSFAQGTSPETNINVFGPYTKWLEDRRKMIYLGHVFPQQSLEPLVSIAQDLPGRYGVTTTYYYDSYPQGGEITFVSQKSEHIETYAIRLQEAVAVAKARTGSEKVIIVTHSMGGLVTRRYLQLFGENNVAAVIMVGTPNNGTSGRTTQYCAVFGSETECEDMEYGSLFLSKLNAGPKPTIPVYAFYGVGCDGRAWDGVIEGSSAALSFATNTQVNGTCAGTTRLLHSDILNPQYHPEVADAIAEIISRY